MDGLLTAVFDAFLLKEQPELLLAEGDALPLFCDHTYHVTTDEEKARRVWAGLEKKLSREALRLISVSWLSELRELNTPLFQYICKVFRQGDISRNFADADVLAVTNIARRVLHEQLRMKQFIRFQKAKDGTYLGVVSPDHNVHYGYYYSLTPGPSPARPKDACYQRDARKGEGSNMPIRVSFEDEAKVPFDLRNGKMDADVLSDNDQLFQDLWRTYFKAICIKERMNPRKQLKDMPRRYWKYMTEKN